jgi:glutamyl-tRNA synthetase
MVLRIEDTDRVRSTPAAIEQVVKDLRWLGIDWDEGPGVEGPNGPYFQSQRLGIYDGYIKKLIEAGKAYYCFDTAQQLDAMRRAAESRKSNFLYPRPEVFPSEPEAEKARSEARPVTVRFAVPVVDSVEVRDTVRGTVSVPGGQIGDFIIQKADGYPTYHFACVVDDELMGITHVIRGQEHLINTHCHVLLQQALGFSTPEYAHMSVTISPTGGKLSKRQRPAALREAIGQADVPAESRAAASGLSVDEVRSFIAGQTSPDMAAVNAMADCLGADLPEINVDDFFRSGYVPEALVNFIALLGWSPPGKEEIMSAAELVAAFDPSRLTKSNSLFDRKKLLAFNTEHIRMLGPEGLLGHFKRYLEQSRSPLAGRDDGLLKRLVEISRGARTLAEIERKNAFLALDDEQISLDPAAVEKVLSAPETEDLLQRLRAGIASLPEEPAPEAVEQLLRKLSAEKGAGLGAVAQPLRVCICGGTVSGPIFDSVALLGRKRTLARIDRAIAALKGSRKKK